MALAGDEKKIRALFSELALQDQSAAPTFEEIWLNAANQKPAPVRSLSRPLLVVTAALLIVAASWVVSSWYRSNRSSHEQAINVSPQTVSPSPFQQEAQKAPQQAAQQPKQLTAAFKPRPNRPNKRQIHQPEHPALAEAALLSNWQSPTQLLMKSPAAVDLNSLPQLNQSVEKLKQFLPRNTELTKESNQ